MTDIQTKAPILPHAPWYQSDVQRYLVLSIALQVSAIIVKVTYGPCVCQELLQAAALVAGGVSAVCRQRSEISPLTLTKRGARKMRKADPAVIEGEFTV